MIPAARSRNITDEQAATLDRLLDQLRADNPDKADRFRLHKAGCSIAYFEPDAARGSLIYSATINGMVLGGPVTSKDGQPVYLGVDAYQYEGFPDPEPPTPRFKVGDRVRRPGWTDTRGEYHPETRGVVTEVYTRQSESTRDWYTRYKVHVDERDQTYFDDAWSRENGVKPITVPHEIDLGAGLVHPIED
jgi:hypothetical protein